MVDERLVALIEQAKYCNARELAEYLTAAGVILPDNNEIEFDYNAEDV